MELTDPYPEGPLHPPGVDRLAEAFALMAAGIPLSLLLDLACADPRSAEVFSQETADLSWLRV